MAVSAKLDAVVREHYAPMMVDTILNENVFLTRMLKGAKPWSGQQYTIPVQVVAMPTGASFKGFDTLSTTSGEPFKRLKYESKQFAAPIALPKDEINLSKTSEAVLDLIGQYSAAAAAQAADTLGTQFYADGTGNSSKEFLGLEALVDDGTNAATIGGLSRTTYTTLCATVTASGGTLTLAKMNTLYNTISDGAQTPNIILCNRTVFGLYEKLLQPFQNITVTTNEVAKTGSAGFQALKYKGLDVIADRKATSGVMYFINESTMEFRAVNPFQDEAINMSASVEGSPYGQSLRGMGFSFTGFIKPSNAYALIGHLILQGELVTKNPKRCGKLTGITTA